MALTVEDGSGVTGADAYDTLVNIASYCDSLGLTAWASRTDAQKEADVLRAMAFLDSLNWHGKKAADDNALEWPRSGVYNTNGYTFDSDEMPTVLLNAFAEATYIESLSAGTLQPDTDPAEIVKRKKVDVLETEYFEPTGGREGLTINRRLAGYLRGLGDGWPFTVGTSGTFEMGRG